MASILQHVGTTLQFAALFLLLLAGLARLLVRSGKLAGSPDTIKLVINRLFEAALAALVLGVLSPALAPALDHWMNADEALSGTVLATGGDPVPDASVFVVGVGSATTNAMGEFNLTVPRSRVRKAYRLEVKAAGFQPSDGLTKTDADMRGVELRLTPAPPNLIKALEAPLIVGQYYGLPFVLATLRVENTGTSLVAINSLSASLNGPESSLTLSPSSWTIINPFGPFAPVSGPIPIPAGTKLDLRLVMMTFANFAPLYRNITALPEYASQAPCVQKPNGQTDPMTDAGFNAAKSFADAHFAWRQGEWHFRLNAATDNEVKTFTQDFALSAEDITVLRESIGLLKQCMSVNMSAPLGQDGSVVNFLSRPAP